MSCPVLGSISHSAALAWPGEAPRHAERLYQGHTRALCAASEVRGGQLLQPYYRPNGSPAIDSVCIAQTHLPLRFNHVDEWAASNSVGFPSTVITS